ncbi:polyprenyl synthetase family protein [Bifidobacterium jacchi]|uniref:Polyprenyl synthetase family protein n=1 Tax=Bifidobacterium jacchi TaxID=2490545 RepID=A0A5N5RKC4_9BIFI|nr:polyprenyl synthetase family protein [Bifidobacterium jacchi]KAB5607746.1 polyprenyl synthetase family protein [Bifidobacterium jacchi]
MTIETDLHKIEHRIAHLVRRHLADDDIAIALPLRRIADLVTDQAVESSKGGKRLRALLALAFFDAALASNADAPTLDADAPNAAAPAADAPAAATSGNATLAPGTDRGTMLDLACAIEVFQTAALVHDDIIDESPLRRGRPSAHTALTHVTNSSAIGRGLGIMLGDLLATESVAIAEHAAQRMTNDHAVIEAFLDMHREVEVGQVLDLGVEMTPLDDPKALADASLNVFRWKTASYTTIAPIRLGLLAAGMDRAEARRRALAIGVPLGVAFQLTDDLLDVTADSHRTGKPVGGDIREGKRTVLLADALAAANPDERAELIAMFEAPRRDETQVRRAIELFIGGGASERSLERITALRDESMAAVEHWWPASTPSGRALAEVCERFVPLSRR